MDGVWTKGYVVLKKYSMLFQSFDLPVHMLEFPLQSSRLEI